MKKGSSCCEDILTEKQPHLSDLKQKEAFLNISAGFALMSGSVLFICTSLHMCTFDTTGRSWEFACSECDHSGNGREVQSEATVLSHPQRGFCVADKKTSLTSSELRPQTWMWSFCTPAPFDCEIKDLAPTFPQFFMQIFCIISIFSLQSDKGFQERLINEDMSPHLVRPIFYRYFRGVAAGKGRLSVHIL